MKPGKLGILAPAPALAALGVAVATFAAPDPESRIAVPLMGVVGILVTAIIARLHRDRDVARFLGNLMLLGVAVRMVLFALIHQSIGPYVFAPDQFTYEAWGDGLVNWAAGNGPFPQRLSGSLQIGFPVLNAVLFFVFGPARAAPAVMNIFLSCWTAIPVYHLALLLVRQNHGVARWAAGLTVFFPSMVLWSLLNVREAPTILTIVSAIYFFVRIQNRPGIGGVAGVAVSLAVLTFFREYLTSLVGIAGAAGIAMGRSRSPFRSLVVGSLLLVAITLSFQNLGVGKSLAGEPTLERVQFLRQGFGEAGSAYGKSADVSTTGGAIAFLPIGLSYFLLAPFPWKIGSTLQAITLPETLIWWAIVPFGLWGVLLALRHDARAYTVPASVIVVVTFAYALVESNVGTAYRHRAQILPAIFVFCALGLRDAYAVWSTKRERALELRRRASSRVSPQDARGRRPPFR